MQKATKVAIAIDSWKLDIFSKQLKADGFEFESLPGPTACTLILKVVVDKPGLFADSVKTAVAEASIASMMGASGSLMH